MERVNKSNRVSWAPQANLRQQCPREVGVGASSSSSSMASNMRVDDGFLASSTGPFSRWNFPVNPIPSMANPVPCIPLIPWRTPPKIDVSDKCYIAAGEESEEIKVEMHRLAMYYAPNPRSFSNPHRHSGSTSHMEDEDFDDRTPIIPPTPIEEPEEIEFLPQPPNLLHNQSTVSQCKSLPSAELFDPTTLLNLGDPVVAAAAVATAIMKLAEPPQSLIDPELLIKLLKNPKMTEKLMKERGKFLNPLHTMSTPVSTMVNSSGVNFKRTERLPAAPQTSATSMSGTSVSPFNIRQHGEPGYTGDASLSQYEKKPQQHLETRSAVKKYLKPCLFHFSSAGCRHGSNCLFSHDMPNTEEPSPKRMNTRFRFHMEDKR